MVEDRRANSTELYDIAARRFSAMKVGNRQEATERFKATSHQMMQVCVFVSMEDEVPCGCFHLRL